MGKLSTIIPLLLLMATLAACNDPGCLEGRISRAVVRIYDVDQPTKVLAIDSISVYGLHQPKDSALVDSLNKVSKINLPLRNDKKTTSFAIVYNYKWNIGGAYNDTIHITYDAQAYFTSFDCGCTFHYTISEITHTSHILAGAQVEQPTVTPVSFENIKLFYHVLSPP